MRARAIEAVDAGCVGDKDQAGPADEKAAFDYTDDTPYALLQPRRLSDRTKAAVENAVAAVGDERDQRVVRRR